MLFCMAKTEIVCFLYMVNEFEELESGKLSLRQHVKKIFFPVKRCIISGSLQRTEPTGCECVCVYVYVFREREGGRCIFIFKIWLRLWRLG